MSRLWVPPTVDRALAERSRQFDADIIQQSRTDHVCDRFNRELRDIDPYLEMRFFGEDSTVGQAVRGRYHLVRRPPIGPSTLISITGPSGEFVEPNSAIFQKLAQGDMWSSESNRERKRSEEAAARAAERAKAREDEARQDEMRERYDARFRAQVSMNRSTPWTQNNSANSRRARGAKRKAA